MLGNHRYVGRVYIQLSDVHFPHWYITRWRNIFAFVDWLIRALLNGIDTQLVGYIDYPLLWRSNALSACLFIDPPVSSHHTPLKYVLLAVHRQPLL